jgi:hypothetical protein
MTQREEEELTNEIMSYHSFKMSSRLSGLEPGDFRTFKKFFQLFMLFSLKIFDIYFQFILAFFFSETNSFVPYHFHFWLTFTELMSENTQRISRDFEHILLFRCFQFFWELTNHLFWAEMFIPTWSALKIGWLHACMLS